MDLVNECSVLDSVEDNDQIRNPCVSEKLGNMDESKSPNNGSCVVENDGSQSSFPEVKGKGAVVLGSVKSPSVDLKQEVSPSTMTKSRGTGLRKWRRIKRDFSKSGESSINAGKMAMRELSNSGANPSKRVQFFTETNQQSQGSASSTNTVVRGLDGFTLLDDLGLGISPSFAAGTDSENSEDRSSKSSTAASAPKIKYEMPVGPHDKSRMRKLSGKNLMHSVQRGSQGKGRVETTKKTRGERVKIEKENSHSSVESDSRSSTVVFMQGTYSRNNGIQCGEPKDYDGENGDEVQGSERQVSEEHLGGFARDGEVGYEDRSPEDVVADSSWEVKEERSENDGSSTDHDPLVEYIVALQSAQEALEKEVLKFKEISANLPVDDSVSDLCSELIDFEQKLLERISERSPYSEGLQILSRAVQSEVVEAADGDVETELEDLFKQKIEIEVEYLTMSRAVQKLRVAAVDQITVVAEQKALVSEQTEILDTLEDTKNKAAMLKKEAEKLEHICGDIASADETLKLHKRVCKYSSCLFVQLVLLVVTLGIFLFQVSPNHEDVVVPT